MARSKHAKPDEELLGEVRSLRKLVKSLRQRIKQLEKNEQKFEESVEDENTTIELPVGKQNLIYCEDCAKGTYVEIEIMNKTYGTCNVCGYHKRLK